MNDTERIKSLIDMFERNLTLTENYPNKDGMDQLYKLDNQATKIIKEALERKIPKKPNQLTYEPLLKDGWRYECPSCKGAVGENIYHPEVTENEIFCCSCGQALDI